MLVWESAYRIGEKEMDSQHLMLFALVNQLDNNINQEMAAECIGDVLGALESYIAYHFAQEEALMRSWGYPHLDAHVATHEDFIAKVAALRESVLTENPLHSAIKARGFVLDWLLGHILGTDADYVRYIAARKTAAQDRS